MAAIVLTEVSLADVKKALVREKSNVRSSHPGRACSGE